MIEAILLLAVIALAITLHDTRRRLALLEDRRGQSDIFSGAAHSDARDPAIGASVGHSDDERRRAVIGQVDAEPDLQEAPEPAEPPAVPLSIAQRFEAFVGGRLPIWIGGIALAFAGFFLVRYSIELGLLGPGARSLIAAAFGLALLVLSEFGPRVPRLGGFVGSDARIAQSLAGAGIATLYGTLYMASELYGLIGIGIAFALVVIVTVLALALSLRHGPPTAIMGLAGGYLAPYVAGLPDSSLTSTLLYLGVFSLGLMGLSVYRRWRWLALAASAASMVWTGSLIIAAETAQLPAIGLVIVLVIVAALAALERGNADRWGDPRWSLLPLTAGAGELVVLNALGGFSPLGWLLYAALAAATMVLAWRDATMMRGVGIAFALAMAALLGSFFGQEASVARLLPAIGIALLFGVPAQLRVQRGDGASAWLALAVFAPLSPLVAAIAMFAAPHTSMIWAAACIVAGLPIVALARRAGEHRGDMIEAALLVLGVALAGFAVPAMLLPVAYAAVFALVAWGRRGDRTGEQVAATALVIAAVAIVLPAAGLVEIVIGSLGGEVLHYASIPPVADLILRLLLPALVIAAAVWRGWPRGGVRSATAIIAGLGLTGFVYGIVKQPLAIGTMPTFVAYGFGERAAITQLAMLSGWLSLRRGGAGLDRLGVALAALGLLRFAWFDLVLLSPVALEQAVGAWPLVNAATLHAGAIALWCWLFADLARGRMARWERPLRYASLGAMVAAVLVGVRQAVQGSILAGGDIATGENYLYSAALLLLALAWLAIGIRRQSALLRVAGLGLLTIVTLKVFLVDAAVLAGLLRVVSFLGLGAALIGIGWAYGKLAASARG